MNRRNFVKISALTSVSVLFNRLTSLANDAAPIMNLPDQVWIKSGNNWFSARRENGSAYKYRQAEVNLKQNGDALSVFVHSPLLELNGIRLKWKHTTALNSKILGDHWERSYGDLAWKSIDANSIKPWYAVIYDGKGAACFGVKTRCNTICWWEVKPGSLELVLDTQSGGVGVQLGGRQLHAADIVTTKSSDGETPFTTTKRFCMIMCPTPRLSGRPVYGINDWYFAYGNNSAKLIKEITALMTDLAPDTENRPFSVIDAGWATYSPLLPGDGGFMDDFSKPNGKFKDMHQMASDIENLGMQPGLWTRPLCAKHDDKSFLLLPPIPGRDDPKEPILDPTIEENLTRIKYNITTYRQWGYKLIKHDYSTYDIMGRWGFQMTDALTVPA